MYRITLNRADGTQEVEQVELLGTALVRQYGMAKVEQGFHLYSVEVVLSYEDGIISVLVGNTAVADVKIEEIAS